MAFSGSKLTLVLAYASAAVMASAIGPAAADSCFDRGVRPIIAGVLDVKSKRVDPGTPLRALGARHRDKVRIADRIERSFRTRISQDEIDYWRTVEDVARSACSRR